MFRADILYIIPAFLIALFQVKVIWKMLPTPKEEDTEVKGIYMDNIKYTLLIDIFMHCMYIFLFFQFFFHVLPITNNFFISFIMRSVGYVLILSGFIESIFALYSISDNWTGLVGYRIKKNQKLITTGIYNYIRHPIYSAVLLEMTGYQFLVNSWLSLGVLFPLYMFFFYHIQLEEKLLIEKYKEKYLKYKSKTKAIIPIIF